MSRTKPKVAVITRTRDRAILLVRAIESVQAQTMRDFVHVIINDGGAREPVDSLVNKVGDDRIKVIHNTDSEGMEAASNKAIQSVQSELVAIHDDDDTWHPEFLARTVEVLDSGDVFGVVARTEKVIEEILESENRVREIKREPWMSDMKVINLYRQCIDNQMTPITFIYRRAVFEKIGYYDEELPVCGDWDFGIRFLQSYDVEILDPGFALAFYHHRKFVPGAAGNTSYAGNEKHRYYTNKIMNKYLRQELADGRLGVGYIMSKLKYDQGYIATLTRSVLPKFLAEKLKKRVRG